MPAIGFPLGAPLDLGDTAPPDLPQDPVLLPLAYQSQVLTTLGEADTGTDVSLMDGLNGSWPISGGDRMMAEHIIRRLTTPRGTLDFSPDDGIDVRDALREDMDASDVFVVKQSVENEVLKDERADDVDVVATYFGDTKALQLDITVTRSTEAFKLVLSVTDVTVDVLSAEVV